LSLAFTDTLGARRKTKILLDPVREYQRVSSNGTLPFADPYPCVKREQDRLITCNLITHYIRVLADLSWYAPILIEGPKDIIDHKLAGETEGKLHGGSEGAGEWNGGRGPIHPVESQSREVHSLPLFNPCLVREGPSSGFSLTCGGFEGRKEGRQVDQATAHVASNRRSLVVGDNDKLLAALAADPFN
jgi:hypothetical protein